MFKKHLIGFVVALAAFASGYLVAPVWFSGTGMGRACDSLSCENGGWVHGYISSDHVTVSSTGIRYETPEKTQRVFRSRLEEATEVIELMPEKRAVLSLYNEEYNQKYYCTEQIEDFGLLSTCSTSLWHVLEFERSKRKF